MAVRKAAPFKPRKAPKPPVKRPSLGKAKPAEKKTGGLLGQAVSEQRRRNREAQAVVDRMEARLKARVRK